MGGGLAAMRMDEAAGGQLHGLSLNMLAQELFYALKDAKTGWRAQDRTSISNNYYIEWLIRIFRIDI